MRTKYKDVVTITSDGDEVFVTIEEPNEDKQAVAGFSIDEALRLQAKLTTVIREATKFALAYKED
jgi:hypothetical protein